MNILLAMVLITAQDTTREYIFPVEEITSTQYLEESYKSKSPMSYLTEVQINALQPVSIENLLLSLPGVFILPNGNQGNLSTAILRGSNSKESYVYLDGFKLNTKRVESFNLSLLPLAPYSRIEILKGGNSTFFGEGPSGGIINFILPNTDERFAKLKTEFGSFGYNYQEFIFNLPSQYNLSFLFSRTHKDGNDPLDYRGYEFKRENSDFTKKTFLIKHSSDAYEQVFLLSENKTGITGPLYDVFSDSAYVYSPNARENDEILLYGIGFTSPNYYFKNQILRERTYFFDPDSHFFSPPDTSYYQSFLLRSAGGYRVDLKRIKWHFGYETYREDIMVLNGFPEGVRNKDTLNSLYISGGIEIPAKLEPFFYTGRDFLSDENFMPLKTGFSLYFNRTSKFTFTYSKSLKNPTSFERIWPEQRWGNYITRGNPGLKSEKSEEYQFIFSIFPEKAPFYFSINTFRKNSKDLIEWVSYIQDTLYITEPQNAEKAFLRGYETELRMGKKNVFLNLFYTYINAKNLTEKRRIFYIPWNSLRCEFLMDFERFSAGISYVFQSERLASLEKLGDIVLWNLTFKFKKIYFFDIGFSFYNLLNKNYEFVPGYPIEGRSFKISLEMKKGLVWF